MMRRWTIVATLLLLAAGGPADAALRAWVDDPQVATGETFELNLAHDGQTQTQPDLAPLQQDFDIVAPSALNVRGYAQLAASWFGQTADLRTVTWDEFRRTTDAGAAEASWEHLVRNHYVSIDKARTLLGYTPQYEPDAAILESVRWLIDHDQLTVANPLMDTGYKVRS